MSIMLTLILDFAHILEISVPVLASDYGQVVSARLWIISFVIQYFQKEIQCPDG